MKSDIFNVVALAKVVACIAGHGGSLKYKRIDIDNKKKERERKGEERK